MKTAPTLFTRRKALIRSARIAAAAGLGGVMDFLRPLSSAAASQPLTDYKALVCIFLNGGNDSMNTIVRQDAAGYSEYSLLRSGLLIPNASLLPLTPLSNDGNSYGLHPSLPTLQSLFNNQKAAILFNTGPLHQPTTRAQYLAKTVPLPQQLFSHSDQIVTWSGALPEYPPPSGFGGRMADVLSDGNPEAMMSMSTSFAGFNKFEVGTFEPQFQIDPTAGPVPMSFLSGNQPVLNSILDLTSPNLQANVMAALTKQAISVTGTVASAISPSEAANFFTTPFPNTTLGSQLKMAARLIHARTTLQMKRQIFFCQLAGWDTHGSQVNAGAPTTGPHATSLQQVDNAIAAFQAAMAQLNVVGDVTTFTASDFGRTLRANGNLGTDHGWGGHHFIIGGAVNGARTFGTHPVLDAAGPDSNGFALIPTTSVAQYAATLAKWFCPAGTDLNAMFPSLANFSSSDLGFMQPA